MLLFHFSSLDEEASEMFQMETLAGEKSTRARQYLAQAAPNDPFVLCVCVRACACVCDLGAPNSTGEELVTQDNKVLPLQSSQRWPLLKVEGSTGYTCQGGDLSPSQSLVFCFFTPAMSLVSSEWVINFPFSVFFLFILIIDILSSDFGQGGFQRCILQPDKIIACIQLRHAITSQVMHNIQSTGTSQAEFFQCYLSAEFLNLRIFP